MNESNFSNSPDKKHKPDHELEQMHHNTAMTQQKPDKGMHKNGNLNGVSNDAGVCDHESCGCCTWLWWMLGTVGRGGHVRRL